MFNFFKKDVIQKKIVYIIISGTLIVGIGIGFLLSFSKTNIKNNSTGINRNEISDKTAKGELEKFFLESGVVDGYVKSVNDNTLVYSESIGDEQSKEINVNNQTEMYLQRLKTNNERMIDEEKRLLQVESLQLRFDDSMNEDEKIKIQEEINLLSMAQVDEPVILKIGINDVKDNYYFKAVIDNENSDNNFVALKIIFEDNNSNSQPILDIPESSFLGDSNIYDDLSE